VCVRGGMACGPLPGEVPRESGERGWRAAGGGACVLAVWWGCMHACVRARVCVCVRACACVRVCACVRARVRVQAPMCVRN